MKKMIGCLIAASFLSLHIQAESLVGIEGKYHGIKAKEAALGSSFTDSSAAAALRIGAQTDEYRVLFLLDGIADSSYRGATISQYMLNGTLDYFIPTDYERFKPFIGFALGYANYKFGTSEDSGMAFGGEAGLLFPVHKKFDIDLFFRYMVTRMDQVDYYIQSGVGIQYKF